MNISFIKNVFFSEPEFENISGGLELTLNDENFGIKYANMVAIINSFDKYFTRKKQNDKIKYTDIFKVKDKINVNDLLKGSRTSVINFVELFLVMSSVSSNNYI